MLDKQAAALVTILKSEDIQNYAGDSFYNLIKAVAFQDAGAAMDGIGDVKKVVFHLPTALFWNKMQRYLQGTFKSFGDQVKMSSKFSKDNADYVAFVKKQMQLIDQIDDDVKVDYFANLTRCFLLTGMDTALYYKLANFLNMCTIEELNFIKNYGYDKKSKRDVMISSLYQYGLFEQKDDNETYYMLSDFGKALKMGSLNYDEPLMGEKRILTYGQMEPLNIVERITESQIDEILKM